MKVSKELTLDELRKVAPTLAKLLVKTDTYQDHLEALRELNKLLSQYP